MNKLFGTDGVRGVANTELTPELAMFLGSGITRMLKETVGRVSILIGTDTRRSANMLEAALTAGILSSGGDVHIAGEIPTPAVAFLAKKYGHSAGAVISASHNPFLDNGIKFFDGNGYKMNEEQETLIEKFAHETNFLNDCNFRPVGGEIGVRTFADTALADYIGYVKSLAGGADFTGLSISLDCANGAMYKAAPILFKELGANVSTIADSPNGENINLRCGSMHLENLQKSVVSDKSAAGFAFDGDGDRCLAVDEKGNIVDGDRILAILALYYKEKGTLKKNTLTATVMSNIGLEKMCEKYGIGFARTAVGDKYVFAKMRENGYTLGGEQSGHIINLDAGTTGDGLCAALQLCMAMKETGKPLSELASVMEKYPQVIRNVRVSNERKNGYKTSKDITMAIKALEARLSGTGRVLVRPSGTEPLIRIMLEGREIDEITGEAEALAELVEDVLS